jgi:hypothetical protein
LQRWASAWKLPLSSYRLYLSLPVVAVSLGAVGTGPLGSCSAIPSARPAPGLGAEECWGNLGIGKNALIEIAAVLIVKRSMMRRPHTAVMGTMMLTLTSVIRVQGKQRQCQMKPRVLSPLCTSIRVLQPSWRLGLLLGLPFGDATKMPTLI